MNTRHWIGFDKFSKKLIEFVRRNVDVEKVNSLLWDERLVPDGIISFSYFFCSKARLLSYKYWNRTHSRIGTEINSIFQENFLTR